MNTAKDLLIKQTIKQMSLGPDEKAKDDLQVVQTCTMNNNMMSDCVFFSVMIAPNTHALTLHKLRDEVWSRELALRPQGG